MQSGVENSISDDDLRGRKPKSMGPCDFFFDKTIGRNPKHFHLLCLFFHDAFEGQSNDNNNVHTICIFFTVV